MNCQEFWNSMPELVDPASLEYEPLERHLIQCAGCAARLKNQRALKAGLRAVASHMSRAGAPVRVESRLMAAFRAHNGIPADTAVRRPRPLILSWAAAAAAVIALAMFLVRTRQPEPATPGVLKPGVLSPSISRGAELAMAQMTGNEAVANDDFIQLPNAAEIGPNEDVNMVRVEMPRSAMIALGIEVRPEQAGKPVQADVMLGADGLARAVRFLD